MFRKVFLIFLMTPLFAAALSTGTSLPVLVVMFGLLLIALIQSSTRRERRE